MHLGVQAIHKLALFMHRWMLFGRNSCTLGCKTYVNSAFWCINGSFGEKLVHPWVPSIRQLTGWCITAWFGEDTHAPSGEDLEHVFEYTAAAVKGGAGAKRRCTWRTWMTGAWTSERMHPKWPLGKAHHGKDLCSIAFACPWPSLSSPVYSLQSDSPHQWSEHGPGTASAGLWVTHNKDPIAIPSLPPALLIGVSDDRVKGEDGTTPVEAHGEDSDRR